MTFAPTRLDYRVWIVMSLLVLLCLAQQSQAQTTAFTYQGKLADGGNLANGSYDMQFKVFDTATVGTGAQQGSPVTLPAVPATDGIFTVQLDFGTTVFPGAGRFLEIAVKQAGGPTFTTLAPRQPVSSTPYAIRSLNSVAADSLSIACMNCVTSSQILNVQGAQITGNIAGSQISGLIPVASVPAGSPNYIQNATSPQASASFNISGNGTAGGTLSGNVVNSATLYKIGGNAVLSLGGAGNANTFVGINAGQNTTSDANTFVGFAAGQANTTGFNNSFQGWNAGNQNTAGSNNSFFGMLAGQSNTTGNANAFFGTAAGFRNTTGQANTFIGTSTGVDNVGGSDNTFIGYFAGFNNSSGNSNTFVGETAGKLNQTGSFNAFFGVNAGLSIEAGIGNTFIGHGAASAHTLGDRNTALGQNTVVADGVSHSTAIGANASVSTSNTIVLGTSTDRVVIPSLGSAGSTSLCRNAANQIATCSSSLRYKTDLQPFTSGLALINRLKPKALRRWTSRCRL